MLLAGFGGVVAGTLVTSRVIGWLLLATLIGGFLALSRSNADGWLWFFSGLALAPVVLIPVAVLISRRSNRAR